MFFFFLRFILGLIGAISTFFLFYFIYFLIHNLNSNDQNITEYLFNKHELCDVDKKDTNDSLCLQIATFYWMIFAIIISSIVSFITLFPFFSIKKKNLNKL